MKIKKCFREIFGVIYRISGMSYLVRKIFWRNRVAIITYHNPESGIFKKHIKYLSKHHNFISLHTLVNVVSKNQWENVLPNSLVITFDDGYKENFELLEIFKSYNILPTVFLCSHIVNTNRQFWFKSKSKNLEMLKQADNETRLSLLKKEVDFDPLKEYGSRQALNLDEIKIMMPHVDFQSHSKYHPILTKLNDAECQEEIEGSKNHLEELLGEKITSFKFPNGDYGEREIACIKKSGYLCSVTHELGGNGRQSDPFRLKSRVVDDDASIGILNVQAHGVFIFLKRLFFRSRSRSS